MYDRSFPLTLPCHSAIIICSSPGVQMRYHHPEYCLIHMKRDNFSEKDLKKIAEVLNYDYDIVFTDKDTGKQV